VRDPRRDSTGIKAAHVPDPITTDDCATAKPLRAVESRAR
jgi:hypothetical protein